MSSASARSTPAATASNQIPPGLFLALMLSGYASMASMRICDTLLGPLAREFDTSTAQTAAVVSGFAIAYGLMQLIYGPAAERWGKLRMILLVLVGCMISAIWGALAPSLESLIASRFMAGGMAAGIIPLTLAWVGDNTPYEQRQATLAQLLGATIIGMMTGQWIGGIVSETWHWRVNFVIIAVLFAAAALLLAHNLRRQPRFQPAGQARMRDYITGARTILSSRWAQILFVVAFLEGAMVFSALAFMPLHLQTYHGISVSASGAMVTLYGVGGLIYSRTARQLLRRLGEPGLARLGGAIMLIGLAMALAPRWPWALPACALFGLGFYCLHGTLQANATQISEHQRAIAVSLYASLLFLGQSFGVALGAELVNATSTLPLMAGCGAGLVVLGWAFARSLRRHAGL